MTPGQPPSPTRRRFLAAAAGVVGLPAILAACGGDGTAATAADTASDPAAGQMTTGGRDLGGRSSEARSQINTNLLPDLVVDDVGRGKQVNLRNVFPAPRPVLLWMWAPY